jgi:hypothetical protein
MRHEQPRRPKVLNILGYEMDTAHAKFWKAYHLGVYTYDPADDGPEVHIISYFNDFPDGHYMALLSDIVEVTA